MSVKTIKEFYEEELISFKTNVQLIVKDMFKELKQVQPLLFALIIQENKLTVGVLGGLAPLFETDEGKVAAAEIMKKFNKDVKPVAIAFVSEGWAKIMNIEDAKPYVNAEGNLVNPLNEKPSEAEDRKEVVMFTFETHDKEASVHYEIKRQEENSEEAELEVLMDMDWKPKKDGHVGGLMADLLEENYDAFAQMIKSRMDNKENLN